MKTTFRNYVRYINITLKIVDDFFYLDSHCTSGSDQEINAIKWQNRKTIPGDDKKWIELGIHIFFFFGWLPLLF